MCNLGAVTNLASAYLMEPRIAEKITVIWIGGGKYPEGGWEFNQNNDINAARVLFKSDMELWQVPSNVYTTMKISFFELLNKVHPCGEIGKYLVEHIMEFIGMMTTMREIMKGSIESLESNAARMFAGQSPAVAATSFAGEMWSLGDSPCVGLMINNTCGTFHTEVAPYDLHDDGCYDLTKPGSRKIRVYDTIDSHFILNDMIEKIQYHFG